MTSASLIVAVSALALVVGLVWAVGLAARRGMFGSFGSFAPAARETRLAVLQTIAIDPRRRLHLIRCENGQVLVLTGGNRDMLVAWPQLSPGPPS